MDTLGFSSEHSLPSIVRIAAALVRLCCFGISFVVLGDFAFSDDATRFVLLRNGNVLAGTATRDGHFVDICQDGRSEIRLPADQVLYLGETLESLYEFRARNRPGNSISARLADASWAVDHGLLDIARRELDLLSRFSPRDPRLIVLTDRWQQAVRRRELGGQNIETAAVVQASFQADVETDTPSPLQAKTVVDDLPSEVIARYTSQVQPILLNRCGQAGCHGWKSENGLKFDHRGSALPVSAAMTRRNLQEVLDWLESPGSHSIPLLRYATSAHGGVSDAPLADRDRNLIDLIRRWAKEVSTPQPEDAPIQNRRQPLRDSQPGGSQGAIAGDPKGVPTAQAPGKPVPLPPVNNPFNPQDFNRIHHPTLRR